MGKRGTTAASCSAPASKCWKPLRRCQLAMIERRRVASSNEQSLRVHGDKRSRSDELLSAARKRSAPKGRRKEKGRLLPAGLRGAFVGERIFALWRERERAVDVTPGTVDHRPQPHEDDLAGLAPKPLGRRLPRVGQAPERHHRRLHAAVTHLLRVDQVIRTGRRTNKYVVLFRIWHRGPFNQAGWIDPRCAVAGRHHGRGERG